MVDPISVWSWNYGGDGEFVKMSKRYGKEIPERDDGLFEMRDKIAKSAFEKLTFVEGIGDISKPDIVCFQEIGDVERDNTENRIKAWMGKEYELISDGIDAAIAFNKNRFKLLNSERASGGRNYAIANLEDQTTKKTYLVASSHISGFPLDDPTRGLADTGDQELRGLLDKLKTYPKNDGMILGVDLNETPSIHNKRIEMIEKEGFNRDSSDDAFATNYNPFINTNIKIDYIFTKGFENTALTSASHPPLENPDENPSDHSIVVNKLQPPKTNRFTFKDIYCSRPLFTTTALVTALLAIGLIYFNNQAPNEAGLFLNR
ncbi:MAG: hypothetical protein K1000chlam1_00936 [Candidatus Anoxychlamydiales bacterium]|nr:hypothetical protein [Candidatus Anoxychlamydiales bacterium]